MAQTESNSLPFGSNNQPTPNSFRSHLTISATRSWKLVRCCQPNRARALLASPISTSTSVGRKYCGSTSTSVSPVAASMPTSAIAAAPPRDASADDGEGLLDELPHRARLAGRDHVVVGRLLLQHQPHGFDIVARMAPVALGVEIADIELALPLGLDRGDRARDFARDEGLAADRALMIEQDAVGGVNAVGLAVIHRDPVGIELGRGVGTARRERRRLGLRRSLVLPYNSEVEA